MFWGLIPFREKISSNGWSLLLPIKPIRLLKYIVLKEIGS
jgi:hypothetical protein